ncbi:MULTISPECIES: LysM peptidoglycan-binding and 3D domain-containing protein [unclassified Psychrobacillus]|uniref:LysM peptidoglycan-binding and 3D domain-containing protein n=1 Tax=unclassified Psychrobacillus TaxID=2636677 RepID=UPI00146AC7B2|nr:MULTISPECIES: LysM peptidoglycan-binding and 3D domain-containing protein [unclassified Psychrobacillus]MCM3358006.1 LysM peptidoglycan-binding domain-containing protein [Psychrobacillus sp. MER TA 171]NME06461.1 LysM peptidoglycan-binding domain-containing protein [Psychrobacillus sp. BL-248-WT-3]
MKKHIVALTAIAALSVGTAGQASASSVHTVEKGDTLWSISQENNVSVENIQVWNDLDSTIIYPSQQLQVEESTGTYTVVSGDTIYGVAVMYGMSVTELMTSNQLIDDLIHPGDKLVVSGDKVQPQVSASQSSANSSTPSKPAASTDVKELTVTATAYTASCEGCSGITSTGIDLNANPNQKVVAVDPTVIPLGSKVWVEGYGEAIAGDIGGAIKGNKIDVYMPSYNDAINWGRQSVKVKILD